MKGRLIVLGLLVLAACGGPAPVSRDALEVTLVFDIGGRGDKGFNDGAAAGAERAKRELGARVTFVEPATDAERSGGMRRANGIGWPSGSTWTSTTMPPATSSPR